MPGQIRLLRKLHTAKLAVELALLIMYNADVLAAITGRAEFAATILAFHTACAPRPTMLSCTAHAMTPRAAAFVV